MCLCRHNVNMSSEWNVLAHIIFVLLLPTGNNGSFHDISFYMDTSEFNEQEKYLLSESKKIPLPLMCEMEYNEYRVRWTIYLAALAALIVHHYTRWLKGTKMMIHSYEPTAQITHILEGSKWKLVF